MTHDLLAEEHPSPSVGALFLPLIGSLLVTGSVAALACQPPAQQHAFPVLLVMAAGYLAIAALAHAGAVWLVRRIFHDFLPWPTQAFIVALWSTVAWLPLLSLLASQQSFWVAATLPLITNFAVRFLAEPGALQEPGHPEAVAFLAQSGAPLWRTLLPALFAAAALEAGLAAVIAGSSWLAGLLFAAALVLPLWRSLTLPGAEAHATYPTRVRRRLRPSLAAWILTSLALLPFASSGLLAKALLRANRHPVARSGVMPKPPRLAIAGAKGGLQFVVLTQPTKARDKVLPRPSTVNGQGHSPAKIPFDGDYWFFKRPGEMPGPNARKERGDPSKVNIRSRDNIPMLMEAHQLLSPPVDLAGFRALSLELTNADDRPGALSAEVIVSSSSGQEKSSTSLGTLTLASSKDGNVALGRVPVQETLTFQLPSTMKRAQVSSITVRIKAAPSRSLAAPMVSVRDFLLKP